MVDAELHFVPELVMLLSLVFAVDRNNKVNSILNMNQNHSYPASDIILYYCQELTSDVNCCGGIRASWVSKDQNAFCDHLAS